MKFSDLGLAEPTLRAVADQGYDTATPIQAQTIPHTIAGRDVLGSAQTGTGKTAAFALPVIHRLLEAGHIKPGRASDANHDAGQNGDGRSSRRRGNRGRGHRGQRRHDEHAGAMSGGASGGSSGGGGRTPIRCLVLTPTRELADQVADSFKTYGKHTTLRTVQLVGGVNQNPQVRALKSGVNVCIATPGRLLDLIEQGYVDLSHVSCFILDEADRMLDMGFIPDIRKVMKLVPDERQTLLFSATIPPAIRKLSDDLLRDPAVVSVAADCSTAERVDQSVCHVRPEDKKALLLHVLHEHETELTIVFTRTKHGADKLAKFLNKNRLDATAIHGNKSQNQRRRALDAFKKGEFTVLVATDVAARGLDIDSISHVINFDVPREPDSYVHRIGRTARAGEDGTAITFCENEERALVIEIERFIGNRIPVRNDAGDLTMDEPTSRVPPPPKQGGGQRQPRKQRTQGRRSNGDQGGGGNRSSNPKPRQNSRGGRRQTAGDSTGSGAPKRKRNNRSKRRRNPSPA